jgi:predicted Rossmann fold nucleotide-binding protein DprA/Smf involved in DNA uptake
MKELNVALKSVVESLNVLSQSVEAIAKKLEKGFPEEKPAAKPKRKAAAKPKAKAAPKKPRTKAAPKAKKTVAPKTKKAPAQKKPTALDTVLTVINRSRKDVDVDTLSKKTGFNKKQISNILFKLKKAGTIKAVSRGVYTKV